MRQHLRRPALALAAALLALALTSCSDDGGSDDAGSSTTAPAAVAVEVTVRDGSVVGGAQRHDVPLDREVTVTVTADVAEEAHVHGYDHLLELTPGEPASVTFTADIPGVFEIELEGAGTKLAELAVS